MRVVVAELTLAVLLRPVLADQVAVGLVALKIPMGQQVLLILAVVVAAVQPLTVLEEMEVLEYLSLATPAHKEAQAARSHQSVATPFTHSHLAVLIRHDYARAPERTF
jgi:hypothetical protein